MPTFRAPRGTRDLLPAERAAFTKLESIGRDLGRRYGYRQIETPLFEQVAVFERGIGEVTDVIEKELFRLAPRSDEGEAWALRPEATAGIARAYVQHGMHTWPQPVKVWLTGPMFRYDRPQAGRYRQFWQWDVEAIGDPGPAVDAELIELGARFYREAGLDDALLLINSIGDAVCRPAYVAELKAYFREHIAGMPEVERRRLESNPLRLLDSKDPALAVLQARAPRITDRLCPACAELLGGRPTPGIGFALGLDRVILALGDSASQEEGASPLAVIVGAEPAATAERLRVATDLRGEGLVVRADLSARKLGRQLESAARDGAHFAVILGDELAAGQVQLKDLQAGTQRPLPLADVARELRRADASHHHG